MGNMGYSADEPGGHRREQATLWPLAPPSWLSRCPHASGPRHPLTRLTNTFYSGGAKGYTDYPTLQVA